MQQADNYPMRSGNSLGHLFVIGLTGGIGSGKSTAATIFESLGAALIDADLIAHQLTASNGGAIDAIRSAFGDEMIGDSGALNRKMMRAKAFSDLSIKIRLEAILHPLIRAEINRQLKAIEVAEMNSLAADTRSENVPVYAVIVLPLLFETSSYFRMLNRILVVDCPESIQIRQVVHRSALAINEVRQIMVTQVPRAVRLQLADDVVSNIGTTETLHAEVRALHIRYRNCASQRAERNADT